MQIKPGENTVVVNNHQLVCGHFWVIYFVPGALPGFNHHTNPPKNSVIKPLIMDEKIEAWERLHNWPENISYI